MKKIIELIKQNKFYSLMMILSTAITVTYVMATFLVSTLGVGDISPENNRSRSTWLYNYTTKNGEIFSMGGLREWVCNELYDSLECVDKYFLYSWYSTNNKEMQDYNNEIIEVNLKAANQDIFNLYGYEFLEGRAFTSEDVESRNRVAVLSELGAYRILGKNRGVLGERFTVQGVEYEVIGLTKNTSYMLKNSQINSFYEILIPGYDDPIYGEVRGYYVPYLQLKNGYSFDDLDEELNARIREFNSKYALQEDAIGLSERVDMNQTDEDVMLLSFVIGFMCLMFILIPSINGLSLSQSYLSHRLPEIAVRKAYGATNRQLVWSLVWDNVWVTSIGALLGLVLAYFVSGLLMGYIAGGAASEVYSSVAFIPSELYFDFKLYLIAILTNIVFNVCAIYLPARKAVKQPISTIIKGDN